MSEPHEPEHRHPADYMPDKWRAAQESVQRVARENAARAEAARMAEWDRTIGRLFRDERGVKSPPMRGPEKDGPSPAEFTQSAPPPPAQKTAKDSPERQDALRERLKALGVTPELITVRMLAEISQAQEAGRYFDAELEEQRAEVVRSERARRMGREQGGPRGIAREPD